MNYFQETMSGINLTMKGIYLLSNSLLVQICSSLWHTGPEHITQWRESFVDDQMHLEFFLYSPLPTLHSLDGGKLSEVRRGEVWASVNACEPPSCPSFISHLHATFSVPKGTASATAVQLCLRKHIP